MGMVSEEVSLASLTEAPSSYKKRAWIALAGLLVFVGIYLFLTSWLVMSSHRFIIGAMQGGDGAFLAIICAIPAVFLSLFMVKALFFMHKGGDPGYHEIKASDEPELVQFIHDLADEAGAPRPHKIYLTPIVNAAVFYDLTILNFLFPSKKNLLIGLALVNVLNKTEFKAVLAHEFGHFSQKSMAIGRWVYMSEQVTAHIVGARGALDRLLQFISHIDIRVAWIGWIMSIIVWSIRSLLETIYRLVSMTHMALSREMEYQADLVSVSMTGSDALVNALHKLQAADESWQQSIDFLESEFGEKRKIKDLFTVQAATMVHLRRILADPEYGVSPKIPEVNPESHRVFKEELAQPPQMWLSHPVNSKREENAKKLYIPMPIEEESAWSLFSNPAGLKVKITGEMLNDVPDVKEVPIETTLEHLDEYYGKRRFNRKYQGVYLGRDVTRHVKTANTMIDPVQTNDINAEIDSLYPHELSEKMELLRNLREEKGLLEAIKENQMEASGGIIQHRGEQLQKSDLPRVLKALETELKNVEAILNEHEARCRSVFHVAASQIDGWQSYHMAHLRLLHYAEHSYANILDLAGVLGNTVAVVLADGHVSNKELDRLLRVAGSLHAAMKKIYENKAKLILSEELKTRLKVDSWDAKLQDFQLPSPNRENVNDWMQAIDSWIKATLYDLNDLKIASLNQLLKVEEQIAQQSKGEIAVVPVPASPKVPKDYRTLMPGEERELQTKLGWWDRFHVADGPVALTMRLLVACLIIGSLVFLGSSIGNNDLHLYNGLNTSVVVDVDGKSIQLNPHKYSKLTVPLGDYEVTTKTKSGAVVENITINVDKAFSNTVYNVAGAAPMVEHKVVYGNAGKDSHTVLGNPKQFSTASNYIFVEPPNQIKTSSSGEIKYALKGYAEFHPLQMFSILNNDKNSEEITMTHIAWDEIKAKHTFLWYNLGRSYPGFTDTLKKRLENYPKDMLAMRGLYDSGEEKDKEKLLASWKKDLTKENNPDLIYLVARAEKNIEKRGVGFLNAMKKYPTHPWIAYAAGMTLFDMQRYNEALNVFKYAEKSMPGLKLQIELIKERIKRYQSAQYTAMNDKLIDRSYYLYQMVSIEQGIKGSPLEAYALIQQGKLKEALNVADEANKSRVLRFAAISDGAPDKLAELALNLPLAEESDELLISYGLKLIRGQNTKAEREKLYVMDKNEFMPAMNFINDALKNKKANKTILKYVDTSTRAACYYIVRHLGIKNFDDLSKYPKFVLFASEKPYIP